MPQNKIKTKLKKKKTVLSDNSIATSAVLSYYLHRIYISIFLISTFLSWNLESISCKQVDHVFFILPANIWLSLESFVVVVRSQSHVQFFVPLWPAARQASQSFALSQSLLKLMSIESVIPSNHLILCRPLLLLPSVFPSIRVFPSELALHIRWPKLELQLQHQSFQWIFRVDFV